MLKKNKNILLIFSVGIVLIVSMFFAFSSKKEYHELPKVKIKEPLKYKQFALMLEQDNGEYKESEGELPTEGYVFNANKSGCTDINGKIIPNSIDYDYGTYTVLVDTSKTSYCYLYYDKEPNVGYLRSKDTASYLTKELAGGMYRYQGSFPDSDSSTMQNWICFGTNDQEECKSDIDKYMYRIIGINAKGQLYLLKETFLKEGNVDKFSWNTEALISGSGANLCSDGVCSEWNEADLFKRINGIANGKLSGAGSTSTADTDIFIDNEYYDYLKSGDENSGGGASEWYKLIDNHDWYYGDTTEKNDNNLYNGNYMYNIETGKTETSHYTGKYGSVISEAYIWEKTVNAKISLMYLHDVLYAYPGGTPESNANIKNSWIHFQKDGYNIVGWGWEWLSTRWGIGSTSSANVVAWWLNMYGSLYGYHDNDLLKESGGIRPVFYLKQSATISSGEGTKDSPFVLSVQ